MEEMMAYNTPEGRIKKQGRSICTELGLYHHPNNAGGYSKHGIPDDTCCVDSMFLTIEYKYHMRWDKCNATTLATLPTVLQNMCMDEIRKAGGITFVVDDQNIAYLRSNLLTIIAYRDVWDKLECAWCWDTKQYLAYRNKEIEVTWINGQPCPGRVII